MNVPIKHPGLDDCSAIYANAAYGLAQAQDVVVVTDGNSDCPWPAQPDGQPKTIAIRPTAKLIFLLINAKDDPAGVHTQANAAKAQRVFPDSTIMPLQAALAPSFWERLH